MAPHKTYGAKGLKKESLSKKKNSRVVLKTSMSNLRRPLATLQSVNVQTDPVGLKKSKIICKATKQVEEKNISFSSPSFPGSEELSSIWAPESTFDQLLQNSVKPQAELKEAVVDHGTPRRMPFYNLRVRELSNVNKRRKNYNGSCHSCVGCDGESVGSISLKKKDTLQLTSTPLTSISTELEFNNEFTPILPGSVESNYLVTPDNGHGFEKVPSLSTSDLPLSAEISPQESEAQLYGGQNQLNKKNWIFKSYDASSPDMFLTAENAGLVSNDSKDLGKNSIQDRAKNPTLSFLSVKQGCAASSDSKFSNTSSTDVNQFDSKMNSNFLQSKTSVHGSNLAKSSCLARNEDPASSLGNINSSDTKSSVFASASEESNLVRIEDTASSLGNINSSDTKSSVITSELEESSLAVNEDTASSLGNINSSETKLSVTASDFEDASCSSTTDEDTAAPVLEHVNLRNRKVRWNNQSSKKNLSGEPKSLSDISEYQSDEEADGELAIASSARQPEPSSVCVTEPGQARNRATLAGAPPRVRPSAALERRSLLARPSGSFPRGAPGAAGGTEARRRTASRRFSVAPGKLLAQPRPDSLGFRGLHGIFTATLAEQEDFLAELDFSIGNLSLSCVGALNVSAHDCANDSLKITARDVVLQKCAQDEPAPFSDVFPEEYLMKCRKIGEGLYGEVFMWENGSNSSVLKIIPIAGDELINGERQKTYDEILSEIVITNELSCLRSRERGFDDVTSGFVEVKRTVCVVGKYPPKLLELWEAFADKSGTENDCPAVFVDSQIFIVLELANAGADLEKYQFNNSAQAHSIFLQTAYSLAVAERRIEFEHRDLHWGNVLISETKNKHVVFELNGNSHKIPTHGVQVSIIDFTLSRITYDGCCIYNDLSQDDSLFASQGDYQFDVYRMMKENCRNDWKDFVPANNVLWLHYIADKMIARDGVHFRKTNTKVHREGLKKLGSIKKSLLNFASSIDFVKSLS